MGPERIKWDATAQAAQRRQGETAAKADRAMGTGPLVESLVPVKACPWCGSGINTGTNMLHEIINGIYDEIK